MFASSTLGYRLAMLIALLLVVSGAITTIFTVRDVVRSTTSTSIESMTNAHHAVSELMTSSYADVLRYREHELALRKQELMDMITAASEALDQLRAAARRGGAGEASAQADALQLLRNIRYRKNDYFFAMDRSGLMIEHPDPQFEGKRLMDMQDPNGKYLFREMVDIAFRRGSGFENYLWSRPNSNKPPAPKLTYVIRYPAWDWVIGTGVFLDDIEAEARTRLEGTKEALSSAFAKISFSSAGFFFVLDAQGRLVVAPEGLDLRAIEETDWGKDLARAILGARSGTDRAITSLEHGASLRDGRSEQWVFKISPFNELGWVLASAVPAAEIRRPGSLLAFKHAIIGVVVLCIGLLIGVLSSRRIVRPVEAMTRAAVALEEDRFDPRELDEAAMRKDEIGVLARALRRMGSEIVERERQLRAQVTTLSVVVDRSRVAKEVKEITESDFFQNLQARAQEMRARHRDVTDRQPDATPASPTTRRT